MAKILVIDDDKMMCTTLEGIIKRLGYECTYVHTLEAGQKIIDKSFDVVFLDVQLPDGSGLDILPKILQSPSFPEVIIITSAGDPDGAELAINNGAWDYIEKPFTKQDITLELHRALEFRGIKQESRAHVALKRENIIGNSHQMDECFDLLAQAADSDAAVLVTGETGTGKELFAKAIHENSVRKDENFIVVDCAALPEKLIESVLFGSRKGSFTGADRDMDGLIKQADGGTLFLDEVGELPLEFQKVFLRVLQEHRFRPLGARNEVESNFRIVAATNRNLPEMVEKGEFRSDLLFRLKTITITVPPLRQRHNDIKDIAIYYITKFCERKNIGLKGFSPDFFDSLYTYSWPGNVRELINTLEWTVSIAKKVTVINPKHLPKEIRAYLAKSSLKASQFKGSDRREKVRYNKTFSKLRDLRKSAVDEIEKQYLSELLDAVDGDIKEVRRISGLGQTQLYTLLKKYGLSQRV